MCILCIYSAKEGYGLLAQDSDRGDKTNKQPKTGEGCGVNPNPCSTKARSRRGTNQHLGTTIIVTIMIYVLLCAISPDWST